MKRKTTKEILAESFRELAADRAIVSMPLLAEGMPKGKTFLYGVLSGAVEPIAALVTILAARAVIPRAAVSAGLRGRRHDVCGG